MGSIVLSNPDLLSTTMSFEEVRDGFRDLKRLLISYTANLAERDRLDGLCEQDKAKAYELAFRLKENDNWRQLDPSYRTWEECCKNEFGGTARQHIDRWVTAHEVNRALPSDLSAKPLKEFHTRVLAQVPDDLKEEVLREAKATAPINFKTKLPQLSAKHIATVAENKGIEIKGLPAAAKPDRVPPAPAWTEMNDTQRLELCKLEFNTILKLVSQLKDVVFDSIDNEVAFLRRFIQTISTNVELRLENIA